jgi:hypothetical protein
MLTNSIAPSSVDNSGMKLSIGDSDIRIRILFRRSWKLVRTVTGRMKTLFEGEPFSSACCISEKNSERTAARDRNYKSEANTHIKGSWICIEANNIGINRDDACAAEDCSCNRVPFYIHTNIRKKWS